MYIRSMILSCLLLPFFSGCASESKKSALPSLSFSAPKEEDAMEIQTKSKTKEQIQKEYGEPTSTKVLASSNAQCVERWYYKGKTDIGLGPMEVIMFIDFTAENQVCKHK